MAVPSMAAALAASLPTVSNAPAPITPSYEFVIPASMSKLIDVEAELPITAVQIDGMVVSKILKHARESQTVSASNIAHGLLLGLDLDGVLEVSNSFSLPAHHSSDSDDDKSSKNLARYQAHMLRTLKEVNSDDSVVGFYQAISLGAFLSQSLVDTQAIHQEKLRHGGVVLVHDTSRTSQGNISFKAFRLSAAFLDAYKKSNFSTNSLINHKLTFSSILEEIPVKIRTNALLSAFLGPLQDNTLIPLADVAPNLSSYSALPPSFSGLNLAESASLTRNLEVLVETVDAYRAEEGNLAYMARQIAREKTKADNYLAKRKEESAIRVSQGLAPLPEEDVSRMFKIPQEPSRLESMLLLGQIDGLGKTLETTASSGLAKMYAIGPQTSE